MQSVASHPKMAAMPRWSTPLRLLADLLMPRACAGCDRPLVGEHVPFCPTCMERMLADCGSDYCPRCGRTAEPYLATPAGCPKCRHTRGPLSGVARVGTYAGMAGVLVRRFKFEHQQRLDGLLGALLADAVRRQPWCDQIDALVPVPTDWGGWWRYRFHPAGMIAQCAGARLGVPALPLVRTHGKRRRQTGLPESERHLNIRGAFRLARAARVEGASLCVVDDVSTSGATLREVARVLKTGGAGQVFAAIVAKTELSPLPSPIAPPGITPS